MLVHEYFFVCGLDKGTIILCVTNMYLHNIDDPQIVHGDGLAKDVLDLSDSDLFSCIVMNPPFGGEFNKADLKNFPDDISSSESADLFVARIIYCLKKNGRCGLVLPDGLLFNSDPSKVNLKRLLMTECNLHTVIRLPGSVFAPYTSISTNLLFFEKTGKTDEVWFYRMDMPEGRKHFNKTHPITREDMRVIDEWWDDRHEIKDEKDDPSMTETWKAKKYTFKQLEDSGFNLDLCGFPEEEEIILSPEETIKNFKERRESLEAKLDEKLSGLTSLLNFKDDSGADVNGFSVIEEQLVHLHTHFTNEIRKSILQHAMQGKLVEQRQEEGSGEDLFQQIRAEKESLLKEGKAKKEKSLPEITDDEIPYCIPDSWKWVRFSDVILSDIGGGTPDKSNKGYWNGTIPWMSVKDFSGAVDGVVHDTIDHISQLGVDNSATNVIDETAIIICTRMGLGKTARVSRPTAINQDLRAIWLSSHINQSYFLMYYSSLRIDGSGTTVKGIKRNELMAKLLPLPPYAEQQRIVERLDQILPHIEDLKGTK